MQENWLSDLKEHKQLILLSLLFLIIAMVLNYFAGNYVDEAGVVVVPDLILSHLPVVDLNFMYVYGFGIVLGAMLLYPLFFKVKELHAVISQFSLLVMIRSFFITLTHLKAPAGVIYANVPSLYNIVSFQNDLFFSAHTAIPFLGFLLFRKEKIGIFFLIMSILLAMSVLFMHAHYSIDVFAAFFITYGSYKIGSWLLSKIHQ